jgi:hypothetical protein
MVNVLLFIAIWLAVSAALGVLLGKCIAVGMGTHPRAPDPERAAASDALEPVEDAAAGGAARSVA